MIPARKARLALDRQAGLFLPRGGDERKGEN